MPSERASCSGDGVKASCLIHPIKPGGRVPGSDRVLRRKEKFGVPPATEKSPKDIYTQN